MERLGSMLAGSRLAQGFAACTMLLLAAAGVLVNPATLSAHTGFESSTPADGTTVDQPVDTVTIVFTGEATPVGDQFVALTPEGVVQQATSIDTPDDRTFTIRFDPPLAGGEVGVRWNVQAVDAHAIEGAFSFTVDAPPPTTAAPVTTLPPTTVPDAVEPDNSAAADTTDSAATASAATEESASDPTSAESAVVADDQTTSTDSVQTADAEVVSESPEVQTLDEFLAVDSTSPGETTATVGRLVGFLGVALGVGAFAFVATALRGQRREVRGVVTAVRALGLVVAVGGAIEYVGVARSGVESLASAWSTSPGFATLLRVVGGIGLAAGVAGVIERSSNSSPARALSAAVSDELTAPPAARAEPFTRWVPNAMSSVGLLSVALIVVSFWFDGHTVSKGPRAVHAVVNSVHVVAGSIWVGGVVTMACVVWLRHRAGDAMRVAELVVRFSKVATVVLIPVVIAGGVMAFLVLDSFGQLTGTTWGQILLLKTAAVAIAIAMGAYNHFRLLPALEADSGSPDGLATLRHTLVAEALILLFVVVVTAQLAAASTA